MDYKENFTAILPVTCVATHLVPIPVVNLTVVG